jgi:hypothetical protein
MDNLDQLLEDIKNQYNRVIIINEEDSEKFKVFLKNKKIPIINLSQKLSELISNLSDKEKQMEAWDVLKNFMDGFDKQIIAFENIDYMFSPEVGVLNPISNFNYYSRNKKPIILFIRAKKRGNLLIYSDEGNIDYCEMDISINEGFVVGW